MGIQWRCYTKAASQPNRRLSNNSFTETD